MFCANLSVSAALRSQEHPPPGGETLPQSPAPTCGRVPTSRPRASGQRAPGGSCARLGAAGSAPHLRPLVPRAGPDRRQSCQPRWGRGSGRLGRPCASGAGSARPWHPASRPGAASLQSPRPRARTAAARPPPFPAPRSPRRLPNPPLLTFSCARLSRFWTFLAKMPVLMSAMAAGPRRLRAAERAWVRRRRRGGGPGEEEREQRERSGGRGEEARGGGERPRAPGAGREGRGREPA